MQWAQYLSLRPGGVAHQGDHEHEYGGQRTYQQSQPERAVAWVEHYIQYGDGNGRKGPLQRIATVG